MQRLCCTRRSNIYIKDKCQFVTLCFSNDIILITFSEPRRFDQLYHCHFVMNFIGKRLELMCCAYPMLSGKTGNRRMKTETTLMKLSLSHTSVYKTSTYSS